MGKHKKNIPVTETASQQDREPALGGRTMSLHRRWTESLAAGIALSAQSADAEPTKAMSLERSANIRLQEAWSLENQIARCPGIDGAMAKLHVSVINARILDRIDEDPSLELALVIGALRDLNCAFPAIADALGTDRDFSLSGGT